MSLIGAARRKPRDYALVQLLYRTGLRVSELVGLRWEDAIPVRDGGAVLIVLGKGNRVRRVSRESRHVVARSAPPRYEASSRTWIFAGRPKEADGDAPLTTRRVEYVVAGLGKEVGFARRVTPHWLRHACRATRSNARPVSHWSVNNWVTSHSTRRRATSMLGPPTALTSIYQTSADWPPRLERKAIAALMILVKALIINLGVIGDRLIRTRAV